jgi:RNA polymerase sigma-70 factor (sigma-E family)
MDVITSERTGSVSSDDLAALYERHAPAAVRLAFLLTSDAELARDVVQDAFVRVAGRFRHLRLPDAFDAYLRRAVVNLCSSHFRHARIERAFAARHAQDRAAAADAPDVGRRDELRAALVTLSRRQRTAIVLRYYEDLSEQQVADTMRCSIPAARSLISRGMATLRTKIGATEDD